MIQGRVKQYAKHPLSRQHAFVSSLITPEKTSNTSSKFKLHDQTLASISTRFTDKRDSFGKIRVMKSGASTKRVSFSKESNIYQ